MRILQAALNHRYAVVACLCSAIGGFALGFIVANSLCRETPPASPPAQQHALPQSNSKNGAPPPPTTIAENLLSVLNEPTKGATPSPKVPLRVAILTQHPGMATEDIERNITSRMKRWVAQAEGVRTLESGSFAGLSLVIVQFEDNIDRTAAVKQVRSYAVAEEFYQPPGTVPPLVFALEPGPKIH